MTQETTDASTTSPQRPAATTCWFSDRPAKNKCACGRGFANEFGFQGRCLICALGYGLFEEMYVAEPISGLITYGLSAAAGDPYIVVPPGFQGMVPLTVPQVERLVASLVRMISAGDVGVRGRAAVVLAATTNSWPTMNPSALEQRKHGTSLLAADHVRNWLMQVLVQSRHRSFEATALAILDRLRTADFRDPYPHVQEGFRLLTCANLGSRVRSVFETLLEFYPAQSPLVNERCELVVYEQYVNRQRGPGATMERMYGPLLRYSPLLAKMLKKGTWLSSHARYDEWYFAEEEPT